MHNYKNAVEHIHAPAALSQQVLSAACRAHRPKKQTATLRAAVCAACALALVTGSLTLRPAAEDPLSPPVVLTYEFGLAASAAEKPATPNSALIFRWTDGAGHFRITGEGIGTVTLSTDRGDLWRSGENLSSTVTEAFDPAAIYGIVPAEGSDMNTLDGACLTLTAHFIDGTEKTAAYALSAENLRTFTNENGEDVLIPALSGDNSESIPALYAHTKESRSLLWPLVESCTVSLSYPFGRRSTPVGEQTPFHSGIDIPAPSGAQITAAAAGTVTESAFDSGYGNCIRIDHGGGLTTFYAHCKELLAAAGDTVAEGEVIALVGSTGMSTGPHLHFEVRQDGEAQNPVAYLSADVRDTLEAK